MAGPLAGLRIIEIGSIGPGPFTAMMLADHGAEVIRVERPDEAPLQSPVLRSRQTITLNLKTPEGVQALRELAREAHGLIEGFRPGTTDRLGFGPDVLLADNPRLVYGRMTGWGQTGPYARWAGHDINYISLSGALHAIGPAEKPYPPLALVGDFGGGGMMLAFAMVSAMMHAQRTGEGQVIDCAMTEGSALLMTPFYGSVGRGWVDERATPTWSAAPGRRSRRKSPRGSGPGPAMNGARPWSTPTSASRRCSAWARRPATRTTSRARPSSNWTASCSPRRGRAIRARSWTRPAPRGRIGRAAPERQVRRKWVRVGKVCLSSAHPG